jgi:DNA modification methylase
LGISHGQRPQHLSIRTGYIIPYIPKPKPKVEYKEVIPRMIKKVKRMYNNPFSLESNSEIFQADTRNMPLKNSSVDVIISSPPYYHTLDYIQANHLRLALLGYPYKKQINLKQDLIQDRDKYLSEMKKCGIEIKRVLKKDGLIIFVLGDVHTLKKSINTAEDISQLYSSIGFKTHAIIPDEIPANRTTIAKFNGKAGILNKKQKMDRILIMSLDR